MVASNFDRALELVLQHEGGYVNHPKDPGGATNKGVTQRVYDAYRDRKRQTRQSVRHISDKEVAEIYRKQYWDAVHGDDLPSGLDYVMFDAAVNSGPVQAMKWLQRALGDHYTGKVDGYYGMITENAIKKHPDKDKLIRDIGSQRMSFLRRLKTWKTFGKGWTRRVNAVTRVGQDWAK